VQARGAITSRRSGEVKANGRKVDGATHAIGQRIVDGRLRRESFFRPKRGCGASLA
jgi:hypothetical protein